MIKKLESAGLGFYVRDSQQKLGNILVLHVCIHVPYSSPLGKGDYVVSLRPSTLHIHSRSNPPAPVGVPSAGPSTQYETTGL